MAWYHDGDNVLCEADLPDIEVPFAAVVASVEDRLATLFPEERALIAKASSKRQTQFASGRWCARLAQEKLTGGAAPVLRHANRAPIWPAGLLGTISHADDVAVALITRHDTQMQIGADVERRGRVGQHLWRKVFSTSEQTQIENGVSATALFAAKEAIYKSVFPTVQRYVDFLEVEVTFDDRNAFVARYVGDKGADGIAELLRRLSGRTVSTQTHVLAVAAQPLSPLTHP